MARNRGTFNFSANFEPKITAPLDARQIVQTRAELIDPSTWRDLDSLTWLYKGFFTVVANDSDPSLNGLYWLKDSDYTTLSNWEQLGGGGTTIDVSAIYAYIDSSILRLEAMDASLDASINYIWNWQISQDASIDALRSMDASLDASINYLYNWQLSQDASIVVLQAADASLDASINNLWVYVDGSLTILYAKDASLDASIGQIYTSGIFVKEASLGTSFVWDTSGFLDVSVAGAEFTGDVSTTHVYYETFLDPSLEMPTAVGGIPAGTTVFDLRGDTLTTILNDLLFPTQNPTLTAPSAAISVAPTTLLYEVSANVSLTFTSTLNRGSISPQYSADSPYRSGLPNNFNFTGFGLVDISDNSIPYVSPVFDMSIGLTQSWSVAIGYDSGVQPYDNKGNPYDSSLAAGTANSNTITIAGSYPYYATTDDISVLTKQTLVALSTNPAPSSSGMTLKAEDGIYHQAFEIPAPRLALHALTGIRSYNTNNSQWEYEGGTAATSLTTWTTSSVTENIQGYDVAYTRYTYNVPGARGIMAIRLEF